MQRFYPLFGAKLYEEAGEYEIWDVETGDLVSSHHVPAGHWAYEMHGSQLFLDMGGEASPMARMGRQMLKSYSPVELDDVSLTLCLHEQDGFAKTLYDFVTSLDILHALKDGVLRRDR